MLGRRINHLAVVTLVLFLSLPLLAQKAEATTIDFTNFNAVMSTSIDPATGNEVLSLLVDSSLYGPGGFAGGLFRLPRSTTTQNGVWLAMPPDPVIPPPDDGMPVVGFGLNSDGIIVDIYPPDPFRLFLATPPPDDMMPGAGPTLIGELDFSRVTGYRGSLHLSGLQVFAVDPSGRRTGEVYTATPFAIQAVPEPSSLLMMVSGLTVMLGVRRRIG